MNFATQASAALAVILLVAHLFGVTFGVLASVVFGSVRENRNMSLLERVPDPVSAGVREMLGVFTRDDGYLRGLPPGNRRARRGRPGDDPVGSHGQGLDR